MSRPVLEVADIFRASGAAYRAQQAGHLSISQLRVMSAIEACRTQSLGGHVRRCEDCAHVEIASNSYRNRHCPKCQADAAYAWLDARRAELLPVPYYHVVFTLPASIADIAYTNKAVIYNALFKAASEALLRIAADPKHLGAKIGVTMVLHTWGSALTHHPHVHCIVPGGGVSKDGASWVACRPGFFLPVRVLSRLFRRLMLERLAAAHGAGTLRFVGDHLALKQRDAFRAFLRGHCIGAIGWSTPSSRSPGRSRCSHIWRAIPIASLSPIHACSLSMALRCGSNGRTIAATAWRGAR